MNDNNDNNDNNDMNDNNDNNDNDLAEYESGFLCTYQHIEDPDESDLCYKMQFLQAFGLTDEYDSLKIDKVTNALYRELREVDSFKNLIEKIRNKMSNRMSIVGFLNDSKDDEITDNDVLCFVFSYEYLHLFHREYSLYKVGKNYDFDFII